MKYGPSTEIPDSLIIDENKLAATFVLTNDELELLLDRRMMARTRTYGKLERNIREFVRAL